MDEKTRHKIRLLRELVWGQDIPHPADPEARRQHEFIQKLLAFIDTELQEAFESTTTYGFGARCHHCGLMVFVDQLDNGICPACKARRDEK